MKKYLFNLFRDFFEEELHADLVKSGYFEGQKAKINEDQIEEDKRLEYQRGYEDGQEKSEMLINKLAMDKYTAANWLVNPVSVLHVSENGAIFINREPITKDEAKVLKEEIRYLTNCRIWSILQETIRQKAIEKAVMNATNFEQVLAGKMMIHNLGLMKSIIEIIEKIKT